MKKERMTLATRPSRRCLDLKPLASQDSGDWIDSTCSSYLRNPNNVYSL